MSDHANSWNQASVAGAYAQLEFPNTYYLAYRDLPELICKHISGRRAVDFGCGAGRSTRFLRKLGFETIGIDIAPNMLQKARAIDPEGNYRQVANGDYDALGVGEFDLVQSIFTFDNIAGWETRTSILSGLSRLLKPNGKLVLLDSTEELYVNEWASFTSDPFPENWHAKTGDVVRDIVLDMDDRTPIEDIFWTMSDYEELFHRADLHLEATYKPLGREDEPYQWVNETRIAPWVIFVLSPD